MNVLSEGAAPVSADVVFVHGLRGDAFDTWTVDGVCWPRDLLPQSVKDVRILSWSYDSSIAEISSFSSQNSIFAHAENLLGDLANVRETEHESIRPIVFVGHSLGGLVIKEALCRSQTLLSTNQDPELSSIYSHTAGVVFMGTPHRGSFEENFAKIVSWAAWATLRSPNHRLLSTLAEDSDILERQRLAFVSITEKMPIVCLHEEKRMAVPGTWGRYSRHIVPQGSACYDGFHVQNGSIDGDHNSMCKFSNLSEVGYIRTSSHIKRLVRNTVEAAAAREEAHKRQEANIEDAILQALHFRAIRHRKDDICRPFAETFEWIFEEGGTQDRPESGLTQWLSSSGDQLYWISGKAGSGKSTMMKMLCDSAQVRTQLCLWADKKTLVVASYFFHDRGTQMQKSRLGMLRGLLHEILSCCRPLIRVIFPDFWARLCKMRDLASAYIQDGLTLSEASQAFLLLVQQNQVPVSICCFIDGLDEHEGSDREILEILMELCCGNSPSSQLNSTCTFKMCVSARPNNAFEVRFQRCPGIYVHQHTGRDIALYTHGRLQSAIQTNFPRNPQETQELKKIADEIVRESSGIFLWVRLAVESLLDGLDNRDFAFQLKERIRLLPKDLGEFYGQMIRRIIPLYHQEAYRIFKIILDSPGHFKELRMLCYTTVELDAITRASDDYFGDDTWQQATHRMRTRLKGVCGGLLEVVDADYNYPIVQFIHQTAKDYFQDPSFPWNLLAGRNFTAFNFDVFFMNFQLCLYESDVFCEDLEAETDRLSLYIARAQKSTGKDQIGALKTWEQRFNQEYSGDLADAKLALLDDFMALAVNQGLHSWLRYRVESAGFDVNNPTSLGLPLLYYAIEPDGPTYSYTFEEYNGWGYNEPRTGSPNAQMVNLLLLYQTKSGGGSVNCVPQPIYENHKLRDKLELHLSPTEGRWMTCSPWVAFLSTFVENGSLRNQVSVEHMSPGALADEYLQIFGLFLQHGADYRELIRPISNGLNSPRLDQVKMVFEEVGADRAAKFDSILKTYCTDVFTDSNNGRDVMELG